MADRAALKQVYLAALAIAAWLAVGLQFVLGVRFEMAAGRGMLFGVVQTLSYFTVLTNVLVALVASASLRLGPNGFLTRPSTLSAVTVYIVVVGLIYSLLLRSLWEPTGLQAVADSALHDAVPILYTVFWLVFVPKGTLRWIEPARWLIYPLLYFGYSLVRGVATGLYLYPFADAGKLGYARMFLNTTLVLAGFWTVGLLVVAIDKVAGRSVRWGVRSAR